MLLDLAARISSGRELPDGQVCQPGAVILLTAEDGLEDTVRPRLESAGADLSRCHCLVSVAGEKGPRRPQLPGDLPELDERVRQTEARLVIIDPFVAFLDREVDSYRDRHVRACAALLTELCERRGTAVVLVRHLIKKLVGAVYRGSGSIGIIASARAGLALVADPQKPDGLILATVKSNLAPAPPALRLHVEGDGEASCRVVWDGACPAGSGTFYRGAVTNEEQSRLAEAMDFLRVTLSWPQPATEVYKVAATAGLTPATLRRAKEKLGVRSQRSRYDPSFWEWVLPECERVEGDRRVVVSLAEIAAGIRQAESRAEEGRG